MATPGERARQKLQRFRFHPHNRNNKNPSVSRPQRNPNPPDHTDPTVNIKDLPPLLQSLITEDFRQLSKLAKRRHDAEFKHRSLLLKREANLPPDNTKFPTFQRSKDYNDDPIYAVYNTKLSEAKTAVWSILIETAAQALHHHNHSIQSFITETANRLGQKIVNHRFASNPDGQDDPLGIRPTLNTIQTAIPTAVTKLKDFAIKKEATLTNILEKRLQSTRKWIETRRTDIPMDDANVRQYIETAVRNQLRNRQNPPNWQRRGNNTIQPARRNQKRRNPRKSQNNRTNTRNLPRNNQNNRRSSPKSNRSNNYHRIRNNNNQQRRNQPFLGRGRRPNNNR